MSFKLVIPGINASDFTDCLPDHFAGPVLKDARVYATRKNQVEISVQEVSYPDFSIRHVYGKLVEKIVAKDWHITEGLCGCFIIKNTISKNIALDKELLLPNNHHTAYYALSSNCEGVVHSPGVFEMLEILYSPGLLQQLTEFFPGLKGIIEGQRTNSFRAGVKWTPPSMREIYMQLLNHTYDAHLQRLYFDVKVRELLFHLLYNNTGNDQPEIDFTSYEIGRIKEAKAILETYIDRKPPTIRELSRMVALNEFKLKRGFKQLFSAGIFDWITTKKMYRAKKLLEETQKPIKEIAIMSGYPRITNFITAFRKQFGITPGSLRRS